MYMSKLLCLCVYKSACMYVCVFLHPSVLNWFSKDIVAYIYILLHTEVNLSHTHMCARLWEDGRCLVRLIALRNVTTSNYSTWNFYKLINFEYEHYIYIYIYIYIYLGSISSLMQISWNIIDILCLHIFFWIRSNSRITFIVFGGNWFRYCP